MIAWVPTKGCRDVILGGFLITDEAYQPMAEWIQQRSGAQVRVVHATRLDWLATSWGFGWIRLLDRVDACVWELQAAGCGRDVDRPQLRRSDAAALPE